MQAHRGHRSGLQALILGVAALVVLQLLLREGLYRSYLPTRRAAWIWLADSEITQGPVGFYAVRDFEAEELPTEAILTTASDEESLVFLNAVPIGGSRYGAGESLKSYDVTDVVEVGRNRLVVEARSSRGIGGLLLRLSMTGPGGEAEVLTNQSWRLYPQAQDAIFDRAMALPEGETPHVWGPVPVGRWQVSSRVQMMPTIAELRTTDKAIPARRFRSWVVPRRWRDLGKTDRSSPALGSWVTFDFGQVTTSYLALKLPAHTDTEDAPVGLLFLGDKPGIGDRYQADAYVIAMPGQRVWLAARPRRFRYATFVGWVPVSGADVYPVDRTLADEVWPRPEPEIGPFGLPVAQSGPSLEDEIWGKLHELPGFTVGE